MIQSPIGGHKSSDIYVGNISWNQLYELENLFINFETTS